MKSKIANILVAIVCFALTACTAERIDKSVVSTVPTKIEGPAVTVIAKPIFLQKGSAIKPKRTSNHVAYTEWFYHCYPKIDYESVRIEHIQNRVSVTVLVKKVEVTLSLPVTVRTPANVTLKTLDHEQGHLQIYTDIYNKAGEAARRAAESIVDQKFSGEADTESGAITDAVNKAKIKVAELYFHEIVDQANIVSQSYDQLTEHGTSVQVAIQKAFLSFKNSRKQKNSSDPGTSKDADAAAATDTAATGTAAKDFAATSNHAATSQDSPTPANPNKSIPTSAGLK
jgi:hypothetical protein